MVDLDVMTLYKARKGLLKNAEFLFDTSTTGFFKVFETYYLDGSSALKYFLIWSSGSAKGFWTSWNCTWP